MLCDFFVQRGFTVHSAKDGPTALSLFYRHSPSIVILDRMLPEIEGVQVARAIRSTSTVPILMLTALGEEEERLEGFEVGVDDYVVKPFSIRELESRVRAILRRSAPNGPDRATASDAETAEPVVQVGPLTIDPATHECRRDGTLLNLTAAQFAILRRMMQSPGRVFTRLQLLETFQPDAFAGYERTIDVHIKNLRKEIEPDRDNPRFIETVRGVGYRLNRDPGRGR